VGYMHELLLALAFGWALLVVAFAFWAYARD
jgi:hypothetical protein